jgi:hypothetical protein
MERGGVRGRGKGRDTVIGEGVERREEKDRRRERVKNRGKDRGRDRGWIE